MTEPSIQSLGGKARAESLTPDERSDIASKAAKARWGVTAGKPLELRVPLPDARIATIILPTKPMAPGLKQVLRATGRSTEQPSNEPVTAQAALERTKLAEQLKAWKSEHL